MPPDKNLEYCHNIGSSEYIYIPTSDWYAPAHTLIRLILASNAATSWWKKHAQVQLGIKVPAFYTLLKTHYGTRTPPFGSRWEVATGLSAAVRG
jgi:hypothetical protein